MTKNEETVERVISFAKHTIVWISLLLLIKGHNDLNHDVRVLRTSLEKYSARQENTDLQRATNSKPFLSREPKIFSDFHIAGNLVVDKCILWQQPLGVFQNSCTVFKQTHYDCVHGIMQEIDGQFECRCDTNWWGNLCDMHDCYGRGEFSVASGECICFSSGLGKFCEILDESLATPECSVYAVCRGKCIDSKCICNQTGQIGAHCYQCVSPNIDPFLCPGRTDWSQPYILDETQPYYVCGGGYVPYSSDILVLRYKMCSSETCEEEKELTTSCCNPLAFNEMVCPGWKVFIYHIDNYPNTTNTVFNSGYQQRYMAILNAHHPLSAGCENPAACLARAANQIHSEEWPLLRINHLPNQAYILKRGQLYLGLNTVNEFMHANEALWSSQKTPLYVKPSGIYSKNGEFQYYYVMLYQSPSTFCLGKEWMDPELYVDIFTSFFITSINNQTAYWINLRDQPGQSLNIKSFCGLFKIDKTDLVKIDTDNNDAPYFLGPYKNKQVKYWIGQQNSVFTTL